MRNPPWFLRTAQACVVMLALTATVSTAASPASPPKPMADSEVDLRKAILVRLDGGIQLQLAQGWSSIDQAPRSDKCVIGSSGTEPISRWTESLEFRSENRSSGSSSGKASNASVDVTYYGYTLGLSGGNSSSNFSASTALNEQAQATMHFIQRIDSVNPVAPNPPLTAKLEDGSIVVFKDPTIFLSPTYVPVQKDWVAFHKRCGDRYVSAIIRGAEMNVFLNRTFSSFEQRRCWTRSRKGSFGFQKIFSLGGGSSSEGCEAKAGANEVVEMSSNEHGTGTGRILVVDLATLKQSVESYPARAGASTTALWAVLTPYSDVAGFAGNTKFEAALSRADELKSAYGRFMYVAETAREASLEQNGGIPATNQYISRALISGSPEPLVDVEFVARRYALAINEELAKIRECVKGKATSCSISEAEVYDDYPLRILLPLPKSKLTADVIKYLGDAVPPGENVATYDEVRRQLYAAAIQRVAIENSLRDRCEVLGDCSKENSFKDLAREYRDLIRAATHGRTEAIPIEFKQNAGLSAVWMATGKDLVRAVSGWFVEPVNYASGGPPRRRGGLPEIVKPFLNEKSAPINVATSGGQIARDDTTLPSDPIKIDSKSAEKISTLVSELEV